VGKFSRRAALLGIGGATGWLASNWLRPNLPVYVGTSRINPASGEAILNDASGLSATPVHKHIIVPENVSDALIERIRFELKEARSAGRALNVGAARHSMGGQAIPRDGTAITFDNGSVEIDRAKATFSVNAHGWPVPKGPMGSTVKSLRMVLPDGELVTCSPNENSQLFNLAMGGYGLIGVIVDMEIEAARNARLLPTFDVMNASDFASDFDAALKDPSVTMAYGRLNVERETFFNHALLVTYRETESQEDLPEVSGSGWMSHVASRIYRAQLGNETFKGFRWWNETSLGPRLGGGEVTRNSLINEPVVTLDDRNPDRTDILHEYFVGFDRFDAFLEVCRNVIPASYQEFLNVTLRYVAQDDQSVLSYAKVPRIAAVMSFSQELTKRGEADMARMTHDLIDDITAIGGAYYLPYRPHASVDQLARTYVNAGDFVRMKRELDPDLVLRNNLWDSYLEQL